MDKTYNNQNDITPWENNPTLRTFNLQYHESSRKVISPEKKSFIVPQLPKFSKKYIHHMRRNPIDDNPKSSKSYKTLDPRIERSEDELKTISALIIKKKPKLVSYLERQYNQSIRAIQDRSERNFSVKKRNRLSLLESIQYSDSRQIFANLDQLQSPKHKKKLKLPKIQLSIL